MRLSLKRFIQRIENINKNRYIQNTRRVFWYLVVINLISYLKYNNYLSTILFVKIFFDFWLIFFVDRQTGFGLECFLCCLVGFCSFKLFFT